MILVTVGTHTAPFDRLLHAVDRLAAEGTFGDEEVIVQAGTSRHRCQATRQFAFCSAADLDTLVGQGRLLISHGGIGTLLPALRRGKHIIAIPRLARFGEHHNDHQLDVCAELARQQALFTSPDVGCLGKLYRRDPATLRPFTVACTIREQVRADLLTFQARLRPRHRQAADPEP